MRPCLSSGAGGTVCTGIQVRTGGSKALLGCLEEGDRWTITPSPAFGPPTPGRRSARRSASAAGVKGAGFPWSASSRGRAEDDRQGAVALRDERLQRHQLVGGNGEGTRSDQAPYEAVVLVAA